MPEVARVSINKFTPAITSIGILLQGIITFFLTIHFGFKDYEDENYIGWNGWCVEKEKPK